MNTTHNTKTKRLVAALGVAAAAAVAPAVLFAGAGTAQALPSCGNDPYTNGYMSGGGSCSPQDKSGFSSNDQAWYEQGAADAWAGKPPQ